MLSLDELFIHRTSMITPNGSEFTGIYLALWGVQWASTMPGKHTPHCKGAAKTIYSGKQAALDPVDIYWRVPHTALVTLLSTREWLMMPHHNIATIALYLQMCIWRVIKSFLHAYRCVIPPLVFNKNILSFFEYLHLFTDAHVSNHIQA